MLEVASGLTMQFVIDSSEKLVMRFFIAIAPVAKHGRHIWGRGSHVGPPIFFKAITPLTGPTNLVCCVKEEGAVVETRQTLRCFRLVAEHMHLGTTSQCIARLNSNPYFLNFGPSSLRLPR